MIRLSNWLVALGLVAVLSLPMVSEAASKLTHGHSRSRMTHGTGHSKMVHPHYSTKKK
jgi:hypothetical protein